ncbi:kinase-like domain-containing protein [Rhizophagus diaphanus]|nr:kinase-like domain-containing protein [Rhizophagus diaphanus] [Rhizophagus sp. MUCL 43196]
MSGNEKIDDYNHERQSKIKDHNDAVFEWIPYNQFNKIEKTGINGSITVCSAMWKNGPLYLQHDKYTRDSNKEVTLILLHNTQYSIELVIKEAKKYSTKYDNFLVLYGISQNPEPMIIFYHTINLIKFITVYSAMWKDGPLCYQNNNYTRNSNKEVTLKCLHTSHNPIDFIINKYKWCKLCKFISWRSGNDKFDELIQLKNYNQFDEIVNIDKGHFVTVYSAIWEYEIALLCFNDSQKFLDKLQNIWIISKSSYILILQKEYCIEYGKNCGGKSIGMKFMCYKLCQINKHTKWTDENEKFDNLIQEMQYRINSYLNIVFEWIPYDQFDYIKKKMYTRDINKKVALKFLDNPNLTDKFLNEAKEYSIDKKSDILNVYGISQKSDTKELIIVLEYAEGGSYNDWIKNNYKDFNWYNKIRTLLYIIAGLKGIHQDQKVHHDDLHPGNILFSTKDLKTFNKKSIFISDMGLCEDVNNISEEKNIYGVMPYMAPEYIESK